ncbi:(2Fe-2S)-binding protein [Aquabacterium humicola]|uniref:(2Fe-2S)-binding protein n=1 Tax=Aquabacterium humicola TaxID=3237377 RepID=UPI002543CA86|nr:2Fe-2S iron-sulfur cluster-binding protein [Rubrivivax pictus]
MPKRLLTLHVNGREHTVAAADGALLIDVLRDALQLTGTKQGCDGGECGACTVLVDDRPRLACSTLAVQVEGKRIETIEGQARQGRGGREGSQGCLSPLQQAFHERLGAQCGFCTPGMVMASEGLLRAHPDPTVDQIKAALAGNLCRCTGYVKIIESVQAAAKGSSR